MTREVFTRSILPIAILFSGSLILSNKAYLHLTVSFIQMLKVRVCPPIGPCRTLNWILTRPSRRHSTLLQFSLSNGSSVSKT